MIEIVFLAAKEGRLDDLKVLLDHLPQWEVTGLLLEKVHMSTPLGMSCCLGHKEVVEYLLDKCPASIEITGSVLFEGEKNEIIEGATPLWFAAARGHLDIVKILVKSGADVNSKTKTNSTPLHAACFYGHYEIVKYLVENNDADMDLENGDVDNYGMTSVLMASLQGHLDIVEYQRELVSKMERIDALELLGATFVDKKQDLIGASKLWKRAMEERYKVPVIHKTSKKSPSAAYNNQLEVETLRELEQMSTDPDSMWMEALLVRERILGPEHPDTWSNIIKRGFVYAEMGNFKRCISLWMYVLDMQRKYLKPLDPRTQTLLCDFYNLFSTMMTDGQQLEHFDDILMVLRRAVKEVQAGRGVMGARNNHKIVIVLLLVSCLTKLIPGLNEDQVYKLKKAVHFFVMVGAKGLMGVSPLQLACSWGTKSNNFRHLPTVNLLLECGAPVDVRDNDGDTALHAAASNQPVNARVIQSLLKNGAHFDLVNNKMKTFYDLLQGTPLHEITNSAVHSSLACLAARVVRKHDLELDSLPDHLQDFVLKH